MDSLGIFFFSTKMNEDKKFFQEI